MDFGSRCTNEASSSTAPLLFAALSVVPVGRRRVWGTLLNPNCELEISRLTELSLTFLKCLPRRPLAIFGYGHFANLLKA